MVTETGLFELFDLFWSWAFWIFLAAIALGLIGIFFMIWLNSKHTVECESMDEDTTTEAELADKITPHDQRYQELQAISQHNQLPENSPEPSDSSKAPK